MGKRNLLILNPAPIVKCFVSTTVRTWEMARVLARDFRVILASNLEVEVKSREFRVISIRSYNHRKQLKLLLESDAVLAVSSGYYPILELLPPQRIPVVMDLLNNPMLEAYHQPACPGRHSYHRSRYLEFRSIFRHNLDKASFFICENERQRDFWTGFLFSMRYLQARKKFSFLERCFPIAVVPFGIPPYPPDVNFLSLKRLWPAVTSKDCVYLWNGGISDWYDATTPLKALSRLRKSDPGIKILFLGHYQTSAARKAYKFSRRLGLINRQVIFLEKMPYRVREKYLSAFRGGLISGRCHLEDYYASRTRAYDYFWARLPIVINEGNTLSCLAKERIWGLITRYGNVDDWAQALVKLATDHEYHTLCRNNLDEFAGAHSWEKMVEPLRCYLVGKRNLFAAVQPTGETDLSSWIRERSPRKILVCQLAPDPQSAPWEKFKGQLQGLDGDLVVDKMSICPSGMIIIWKFNTWYHDYEQAKLHQVLKKEHYDAVLALTEYPIGPVLSKVASLPIKRKYLFTPGLKLLPF